MDLSKPNTTSEWNAGPEWDVAEANSAESGTAPVSDRDVEPCFTRRPLKVDDDRTKSSSIESNNVPTVGPIIRDDAAEVSGVNTSNDESRKVENPNPVTPDNSQIVGSLPPQVIVPEPVCWPGLSKRQKKRVKARMQHQTGSSANEPEPGNPSRKRSLAMTADSSQSAVEVKRTKVETEPPSTEKVALIPVTFPSEQIFQNHISVIQEAVLMRLVDAAEPLPHVTCGNLVGGALIFHCVGRDSANWLGRIMSERKIAGMDLKVVDAKDLPKPVKMAWKTKIVGSHDIRLLFRVLQRYNPSLNTDQWKILDTSLESTSSRRIILMDRASADVIRDAGYCLFSGIDVSTFKLLEDSGNRNVDNFVII